MNSELVATWFSTGMYIISMANGYRSEDELRSELDSATKFGPSNFISKQDGGKPGWVLLRKIVILMASYHDPKEPAGYIDVDETYVIGHIKATYIIVESIKNGWRPRTDISEHEIDNFVESMGINSGYPIDWSMCADVTKKTISMVAEHIDAEVVFIK